MTVTLMLGKIEGRRRKGPVGKYYTVQGGQVGAL